MKREKEGSPRGDGYYHEGAMRPLDKDLEARLPDYIKKEMKAAGAAKTFLRETAE